LLALPPHVSMVFAPVILNTLVLGAFGELYCPSQSDFDFGGNIQWHGNGYTMTGSGGVHGKTAFNLIGGYVEFDFDTSNAHGGVNTNLYTISPNGSPGGQNYCDIQDNGHGYQCMEMDIIEANGNCMSQATWHTWPNHDGDCDEGGCWGNMRMSGNINVRASFSQDGWMDVTYNGQHVSFTPQPSDQAKAYVVETMRSKGASLESSQWVGWVPGGSECPGGGDLGSSSFTVSNIRVSGTVVQGMHPSGCEGPSPSPTPSPTPSPSPSPGWRPCSGGVCCNPHTSVPQYCPGQIRCQECGGGDACQCPGGWEKNESLVV